MTIAEKIEMYKGKKAFIKNVSKAFEATPRISSVTSIDYEVYRKEIDKDITYFAEYDLLTETAAPQTLEKSVSYLTVVTTKKTDSMNL